MRKFFGPVKNAVSGKLHPTEILRVAILALSTFSLVEGLGVIADNAGGLTSDAGINTAVAAVASATAAVIDLVRRYKQGSSGDQAEVEEKDFKIVNVRKVDQ